MTHDLKENLLCWTGGYFLPCISRRVRFWELTKTTDLKRPLVPCDQLGCHPAQIAVAHTHTHSHTHTHTHTHTQGANAHVWTHMCRGMHTHANPHACTVDKHLTKHLNLVNRTIYELDLTLLRHWDIQLYDRNSCEYHTFFFRQLFLTFLKEKAKRRYTISVWKCNCYSGVEWSAMSSFWLTSCPSWQLALPCPLVTPWTRVLQDSRLFFQAFSFLLWCCYRNRAAQQVGLRGRGRVLSVDMKGSENTAIRVFQGIYTQ